MEDAKQQLATATGDRKKLETELSELKQNSAPTSTSGHLYQEIENLKERNRLLLIKSREERQKLQEELAGLKYRDESQSRRLEEKQALTDALEIQLAELRSQFVTERADREKSETQLADLKQKSATAGKDLPDAATILSQLRGKRKKTPVTLADMVAIWDALEEFWNS